MRKRYGPLFRTNDAIAGPMIHVADRAAIEQIFKWKPAQYHVAEPRQIMEPVTGPTSILLLDGERHLRMRKLMLPPFHGEAIARFTDVIDQTANREIDRWQPGDKIRTRTLAQTITLEVIIRAVFGVTDPIRIEEFKRLLPGLSAVNPLLLLVQKDLGPRSPWGRFLARRDRVDAMLYEEIERRRGHAEASNDSPDDMLTLLLAARDEDGSPLTDRELRDELITLLVADPTWESWRVGLLVALVSMPWWAHQGTIRSVVELCCYIAIAQMWNLMAGYGCLVSVGQQAFMGIAAYAMFALAQNHGVDPFVAAGLCLLVPAILAVPTYALLHRLDGPYFAIGTWVVAEAAGQAAAWRRGGFDVQVSFNLSPRELWQPHAVREIVRAVEGAGVEPASMVVDITESMAMHEPDRSRRVLEEILT